MANAVAEYLKKSINPGGTPKRMKEWMGAMLLFQVLATVLPGKSLTQLTWADSSLLSAVLLFVFVSWGIGKEKLQVPLSWGVFYTAMALLVLGGWMYGSGKEEMIVISSWSAAMYILERRDYISFADFAMAMLSTVVTLAVSIVISYLHPQVYTHNTIPLMIMGVVTVLCNSYLLIIDFRHGKHRMDFFERHFNKISELSSSLSGILMLDKPIKEAMWDVTATCIPVLGLEDFIIYLYDKDKNRLVQVAAYGQKNLSGQKVHNPIEIEPGQGIVGTVFSTRKPVLVEDTSSNPDYIVDDAVRFSELAVPILIGDEVFGVIDSEHSQKGFYKHTHMQLFNIIAAFCSIKAAQHEVRRQILEAEKNKLEVAKMRELEQLKNKFITNISHDLKTPLSLILGPANQMFKTSDNDFIKKQAGYIIKNTDHLMAMVEQLLQLNKIEQGIEKVYKETVDLDRMLGDIETQYTPLAEENSIAFKIEAEGGLLLTTDSFKLSQCIHNLLQNAFKYASARITITAKRFEDNTVSISIADDGVGIHPDEHRKIFDRFYKIDVNNHKGTGIGLSLVKEYMTQLKGTVGIDSMPGKGAVFTLTIPGHLIEYTADELLIDGAAMVDDKLPLVVIAEDHVELNEFIAQSLQHDNYRCLRAYNGREALRLVEQHMPDLVITDLMMPEMSGEELVGYIKESDSIGHIPIIVLTAKNQVDDRIDLYQAGADNYIPKPFKVDELLAVVENVLKQRKKLRDKFYLRYMPEGNSAIRTAEPDNDIAEHDENPIVKQCMDYILANIDDEELNVNTLGASLGMGRNRLQKEIKTATGMTPVEFIRSIRLHEAYKMMQGKQYNISEIAYKTGFNNLSYFSRSFKAQFGYAPSEMASAGK